MQGGSMSINCIYTYMKKTNIPSTYCSAAFRQIYSDNAGRYRLCCHATVHPSLAKYSSLNTTPFEYFLSDEMEDIRQDMFEGKPIAGCEGCYKLEERGHESWRQWKYNTIYPVIYNVEKVALKLRIFGSFCNLGCYMCYPYNSSTRRIHMKNIDIPFPGENAVRNLSSGKYENVIDDIIDNIELVDYMNITGGEPLQLPRLYEFLARIPDKNAKNITLSFDTNLSELEFRGHTVYDIIAKFKKVQLGVSCDHYGDRLAWIRYPLDVARFENNLQLVKDNINNINVTVSLLNIDSIDDIIKYYSEFNVTVYGIVCTPEMISIRNLPDSLKAYYLLKYDKYDMVVQELKKPAIPGSLEKGLEYCRKLNDGRDMDFNQLFDNLLCSIEQGPH